MTATQLPLEPAPHYSALCVRGGNTWLNHHFDKLTNVCTQCGAVGPKVIKKP